MPELITHVAGWCAAIIETIGIAIITIVALYSLLDAALRYARKQYSESLFEEVRLVLGRGILLGLEFLIAADIIYTVAVDLTLESIGTLALVVLIRTFLSFTLEVELTGKWPWQNGGQ